MGGMHLLRSVTGHTLRCLKGDITFRKIQTSSENRLQGWKSVEGLGETFQWPSEYGSHLSLVLI